MSNLTAAGPNAEQIEYWNETAGPKWVDFRDLIDDQIAPLGVRAMERAGIAPGDRVLDVGCGCGQSTLELGRRVGPQGSVLGVDISTVMLARARELARAAGLSHVRFENVDAQTERFPADSLDLVYSRFGVMFFSDPPAAFGNLRAGLRPDGRLAFVCWQGLSENPWMLVPVMAAAQHVALPPPPAPDAPGPFAFADAERVRGILTIAGFADVAFEGVNETLTIGGGRDLDEAVEFLLQMGPTGRLLRDADPGLRPRVAAAVREALLPYRTENGIRMASASWIVTARRR
jgi:SAM-dependent methyltransferase